MKEQTFDNQKQTLMTLKEVLERYEAGTLSSQGTYISDEERMACGIPLMPAKEIITDEMYITSGIPLMSEEEVRTFKK